jgi:hypothetical protein
VGAVLEFRTLSVDRGGSLLTESPRVETTPRRSLLVHRGAVTEALENTPDGLEQSWIFDQPPHGSGDLIVRVRFGGQRYVGETESGFHFRDPASGLGVRYGRAFWVDAKGRRTPIAMRWTGDAVVMRAPAALLAASAYPAALDPTVTPEQSIDNPVYAPALEDQNGPSVGFNGTCFLVAWQDKRLYATSGYDIYGARVASMGGVLDPDGIAISTALNTQYVPVVTSNGDDFFVAWQDARYGTRDIVGARVSSEGVVRDTTGILIAVAGNQQEYPAVAFDGTNYFVVWQDSRSGGIPDIYGCRVSTAGVALDTSGILISNASGSQKLPSVAFDGADYLVAWQDSRNFAFTGEDIYAARVTPEGVVLDATGFVVSSAAGAQTAPRVAFGSALHLIAWTDERGSDKDIYAARVTPTGNLVDSSGIVISDAAGNQDTAALAFDGANFLIVWSDARGGALDIYGARVSEAGAVLDPAGLAVSAAADTQELPAVTFDGEKYLLVWQDKRNIVTSGYDIYGAFVAPDGDVFPNAGLVLATRKPANQEQQPSLAYDGTNYLAVWRDQRFGGDVDIYGGRLSGAGDLLDSTGIAICAAAGEQSAPAATAGGGHFFVAWQDKRSGAYDVYGARVSPDGVVEDAGGFAVSAAVGDQTAPAVASDGAAYLAAWQDKRTGNNDIHAAQVSAGGVVQQPAGILVATGAGSQEAPTIAAGDGAWLAAWRDDRNGAYDIYGARLDAGGAVLDASGIQICGATGNQSAPTATWSGSTYFVAWEDGRTVNQNVYAGRVGSDGAVLDGDGFQLSAAAAIQQSPAAVFDGVNVITVWVDYRASRADIYASWVSPNGVNLLPAGAAIAAESGAKLEPTIASSGAGYSMVAYSKNDADGSPRIRGRRVWWLPLGVLCSADSDCISGYCVDGVCCDTACGGGDPDDCQVCDAAGGAVADGVCTPRSTSVLCRPAAGVCDVGDYCDGVNGDCPTDQLAPDTQVCRAATDLCDAIEYCTGDSVDCPADEVLPESTVCRDAVDLCDAAEYCDGAAKACPPDSVQPPDHECRPAAGLCDIAELCDGSSTACPPDAFVPAAAECRAAAGECDLAEVCPGDGPDCPADEFLPVDAVCRDRTGPCDLPEHCPGNAADCPRDAMAPPSQVCRPATGPCDREETCDGFNAECPADAIAPATTVCREAADLCDQAEYCTGVDSACPPDALKPAGEECRAAAGLCDVAEICTGADPSCPTDAFRPSGYECRPAAGVCDVPEFCTGDSAGCPADVLADEGVVCRPAINDCDAPEVCAGESPACPLDLPEPDGTACDDGVFCNGADSCLAGSCETHAGDPCPDESYCNGEEVCDEEARECFTVNVPSCFDDGLWCNGEDFCNDQIKACDHSLTPGTRCPDDRLFCNGAEVCDEDHDACIHTGDPCPDDGVYCNGEESCDENNDECVTTGVPCAPGQVCLEGMRDCVMPEDTATDSFDAGDVDLGCGCL